MERYESWLERAESSLDISKIAANNIVYCEDLRFMLSISTGS
jgi:hypothetical protein